MGLSDHVYRNSDIDALFLAVANRAGEDVNAPAAHGKQFVVPKPMPASVDMGVRNAGIETRLYELPALLCTYGPS
jgi:hypothetical protein